MTTRTAVDEPRTDDVDRHDEGCDADESTQAQAAESHGTRRRRFRWAAAAVPLVIALLVMGLALAAGYLKWRDAEAQQSQTAAIQSVPVAGEGTIAMLSYSANTVEADLGAARDRMTGPFRDDFDKLINEVVIPGAKQKQISSVATVPAAASVSATEDHAVVLVYVNQKLTMGGGPPTDSISSVRVSMDRVDGRWLISNFEPV